jgi:hypothetical protein
VWRGFKPVSSVSIPRKYGGSTSVSFRRRAILNRRPVHLRHQVRNILAGDRGLVAKWVTFDLRSSSFPPIALSPKGKKILSKYIKKKQSAGVKLFNGPLLRVGFIPREKSTNGMNLKKVTIQTAPLNFFDYLGAVLDPQTEKLLRAAGNRKKADSRSQVELHEKVPYILACDSILEIGNDGKGNPTHILVLKRNKTVPIEPNVYDFPAGLVRGTEHPLETVRKRTAAEMGIKPEQKILIGPGFKPTNEDAIFALHVMGRGVLTYNGIIIERASSINARQAKKIVEKNIAAGRAKGDKWGPSGFRLIPRNPKAIAKFARENPMVMPEILRLYAGELQRAGSSGQK